jgi:hypothetical protein
MTRARAGETKGQVKLMYKQHRSFSFPEDDSIKIWRYMDFTKFVSMLESTSLYFARADQLEDPYENAIPKCNQDAWAKVLKQPSIPEIEPLDQQGVKLFLNDVLAMRLELYVNCWHMNSHQSAAMWKLYLKSDEGIAIQSTAKQFACAFSSYPKDVFIGEVSYIDYETDIIPDMNTLAYIVRKRISFAHERELRAVVWDKKEPACGIEVPVNLNELVETVFVAPTAPAWFATLVKAVAKRYGLNAEVRHSDLYTAPLL